MSSIKNNDRTISPYGTWKTPISAKLVASGSHLWEMKLGSKDGNAYCVEVRPTEEGRYVIVKVSRDGKTTDLTPAPFNARSKVHEYGGGGFSLSKDKIVFSNFSDQRLYLLDTSGGPPVPITPEGIDARYADGVVDESRNDLIYVQELHTIPGKRDALNSIVRISLQHHDEPRLLLSGNDFYSFPRLNPDGTKLVWITWNYPNMPFDGAELWIGSVESNGEVTNKRKIAGGLDESVTQPRWAPSGEELYFISDRTGWWNLYRFDGNNTEAICPKQADFCHADWYFGLSSYALRPNQELICTYFEENAWHLAILNTSSLEFRGVKSEYTEFHYLEASANYAAFLGASSQKSKSLIRFDFDSERFELLYESPGESIPSPFFSSQVPIEFPTTNNVKAHAFYYAPTNPDFVAPEGELPPLVVIAHGGPTSSNSSEINGGVLFWTSRGFAVLDVNYGGSTGYGREYRRRLNGQWGVVDIDDCVNGAMFLVRAGKVDENRMVIRGGSAGGYTTLCALAFRKVFRAGACSYGISDLEHWELEAHKFEAQYLHSLIGIYPQERELYLERSPTNHLENISDPLIFFQGLEDRVVPPNQTEMMVEGLKKLGKIPVASFYFEREQHDFRRASSIERALEASLFFFSRYLDIEMTEEIPRVKIVNDSR